MEFFFTNCLNYSVHTVVFFFLLTENWEVRTLIKLSTATKIFTEWNSSGKGNKI